MEELFQKYFEGELSPLQEKELWAYIKESPENEIAFRNAEKVWRSCHVPTDMMERDFSAIEQKVVRFRSRRQMNRYFRYAFCAASVILMSIFGYSYLRDRTYSYAALPGHIEEVELPDGSLLSLNSGSKLQYTYGRCSKTRKVYLIGEAFFEVAKDPSHPFVVSTDNLTVTVLGTKFMVSDYPEDCIAQIALTEGEIKLSAESYERVMSPGETVLFDGKEFMDSHFDMSQVCQWTSDIISYDSIELGDFVNRLAREFNIDLTLEAKGFLHEKFRASFSRSDSIDTILETVCNIFPLKILKTENTYSLIYTKK